MIDESSCYIIKLLSLLNNYLITMFYFYLSGFLSLFLFNIGNASVRLKTTDGVWGGVLLEQKTLVCQSKEFPLKSCVIKESQYELPKAADLENLAAGQCGAQVTLYEYDERKKYSCNVILTNNTQMTSESPPMRVLDNRKIPSLKIETKFPFSINLTLQRESNISLYCKYRIDNRDPEIVFYYLKWKTEILENNPAMEGKFNKTTETVITSESGSNFIGSNVTLTFDPNIFITAIKATCTLYHSSFGDKILSFVDTNIIQKYPTAIVRITNSSKIWSLKGGHLSLRCNADGNPPPVFQWVKKLNETEGRKISNSTDSQLVLLSLSSEDNGTYECWARNELNSPNNWIKSNEINVYVNGAKMLSLSIFIMCIAFIRIAFD